MSRCQRECRGFKSRCSLWARKPFDPAIGLGAAIKVIWVRIPLSNTGASTSGYGLIGKTPARGKESERWSPPN